MGKNNSGAMPVDAAVGGAATATPATAGGRHCSRTLAACLAWHGAEGSAAWQRRVGTCGTCSHLCRLDPHFPGSTCAGHHHVLLPALLSRAHNPRPGLPLQRDSAGKRGRRRGQRAGQPLTRRGGRRRRRQLAARLRNAGEDPRRDGGAGGLLPRERTGIVRAPALWGLPRAGGRAGGALPGRGRRTRGRRHSGGGGRGRGRGRGRGSRGCGGAAQYAGARQ